MIKKIGVVVIAGWLSLNAADTTVTATMGLMSNGLNQIQTGFMYNKMDQIKKGLSILENANTIFSQVDVKTFIPKNHKIGATKNIMNNFNNDLKVFKGYIDKKDTYGAAKAYGNILTDCISCHKIVRGW